MLDGSSWVKNSAVMSSTGSTQKAVLAAPPQAYSPALDSTLLAAGSSTTEKPRPKPTPSKVVSANSGRPTASRSAPPGRWLRAM